MTKTNSFVLLCFAAISVIFYAFPEIDLNLAASFYSFETGFPRDGAWLWIGAKAPNFLIPVTVITVLVWGYLRFQEKGRFSIEEFRDIIFFSISTLFSALLLVWCFKLGFSRIRPRFIEEFGGFELFTPAYVINPTAKRDVSFISGHAATGFMFFAAAFLYEGRRKFMLILVSLFLGCFIGYTRLVSGNHFLSDVVVSGFVVYLGTVFIFNLLPPKTGLGRSHNLARSHTDLPTG